MLKGVFFSSFFLAVLTTLIVVSSLRVGFAQVRTSSNYQLQSDSINIGGGYSTSTSYIQESTVGEIATGQSDSTSYSLRGGYQQMQEVFISLSTTGDVAMSPSLPGITGGTSNGSSTFTVITDDPAGYQLTIEAENNPAMQSLTDTIADYNAGGVPDFAFTAPVQAHLGYTPEGVDIVQAFLDDGGACNTGSQDSSLACWDGLSTTADTIAQSSGPNHPNGATTTVHFRVEVASGGGVEAGLYTATTTVTAIPL